MIIGGQPVNPNVADKTTQTGAQGQAPVPPIPPVPLVPPASDLVPSPRPQVPYVPPYVPGVDIDPNYREYLWQRYCTQRMSRYPVHHPTLPLAGQPIRYGVQYPGEEWRHYPPPTRLGADDPGYSRLHLSETNLPIEPNTRQRAVYGHYQQQPVHGPALWDQYFREWTDVGHQYRRKVPTDQPLPAPEMAYMTNWGFFFSGMLGKGGFGTVYKVLAKRLRKDVNKNYYDVELACKVLSLEQFKGPATTVHSAIEKLCRETTIHNSLSHQNVVKMEHVFHVHDQITGFPFVRCLMFLELCSGDLESVVENSPNKKLCLTDAFYWFIQICFGLQYLHDQNVVHLDIKIHNIMYRQENNDLVFKLGDFGLAKRHADGAVGKGHGITGTTLYLPHEVIQSPTLGSYQTKPVDIYCLGLTLAESVSGVGQFKRLMSGAKKFDPQVEARWGITAELADLLVQMTRYKPKNRATIAQIFAHPWVQHMMNP